MLLGLLIQTFAIRGPVILGLDDTIERRRGAQIKPKESIGSGSFEPWPLCQGEWFALVEPDAAHPIPWAGRTWLCHS